MKRLSSLDDIAADKHRPNYRPSRHATGVVHLGVGAFHRAHQAAYTDEALAAEGGDWRIIGVSLRSTAVAASLLRSKTWCDTVAEIFDVMLKQGGTPSIGRELTAD